MNITINETQYSELLSQIKALQAKVGEEEGGMDDMWALLTAFLIFIMQAGFALLESGSIGHNNVVDILFKNILDSSFSSIIFWGVGYGIAYGDSIGGIIGGSNFGLNGRDFDISLNNISNLKYSTFFFQWAFASTSTTIISGSVAERCKLDAYFLIVVVMTALIYPVVAHWVWGGGWLSPFGPNPSSFLLYGVQSNNFIDFAGSSVVHIVGGFSGLVAAIILGPRNGRFDLNGNINEKPAHNLTFVVLGGFLLWFGWYGFNSGSTKCIVGNCSKVASLVAVNTTISASSAACAAIFYQKILGRRYNLSFVIYSIISGLVSITAGCAVVDLWGAFLVGFISPFIYLIGSHFLKRFKIDDPLDASAVHGFCGVWGTLSVGIFGKDQVASLSGYYGSSHGAHPFKTGSQFAVQLIGVLAILTWTIFSSFFFFKLFDFVYGLRVDKLAEDHGLDKAEHGTSAYNYNFSFNLNPSLEMKDELNDKMLNSFEDHMGSKFSIPDSKNFEIDQDDSDPI